MGIKVAKKPKNKNVGRNDQDKAASGKTSGSVPGQPPAAGESKGGKKPQQENLLPPPDKLTQKDITGNEVIKQTAPKEVREACECYFSKKEDFNCAKSNLESAKERILSEMRKAKITLVCVKDNDGVPRRIQICGEEKLKIEKDTDS